MLRAGWCCCGTRTGGSGITRRSRWLASSLTGPPSYADPVPINCRRRSPPATLSRRRGNDTQWPEILILYQGLLGYWPTPVVRLNRAIALRNVAGPALALDDLEPLGEALDGYHLYHATRAEMLRELGRADEARRADQRALQLTTNPAERALIEQRLL